MENNKYDYEPEYRALVGKVSDLQAELAEREEKLNKQELLLEELYKLVYYKRAWLALSDDNIKGMQEVIGKVPVNELEESAYPAVMPKSSDDYDDNEPWGI